MQTQSSGKVYRQLFRRIIKEQLPWSSGRTITSKFRFSGGSYALPGLKEYSVVSTSGRSRGLWRNLGLDVRGADLVMVRRVEGLGGLRQMGIIERPAGRTAQHGVRTSLPPSDEERHTDEFLKEEKRKQAAKVRKTEQVVGGVVGQSLAATDAEFVQRPGSNSADTQKDIAEEMKRIFEFRPGDRGGPGSGSWDHADPNGDHSEVDEEVHRGLVADSAFPMGRTEKADEEAFKEDERKAETTDNVSEHGSFKAL
ncbi:unnamed protein product [Calypogeia fissa]